MIYYLIYFLFSIICIKKIVKITAEIIKAWEDTNNIMDNFATTNEELDTRLEKVTERDHGLYSYYPLL